MHYIYSSSIYEYICIFVDFAATLFEFTSKSSGLSYTPYLALYFISCIVKVWHDDPDSAVFFAIVDFSKLLIFLLHSDRYILLHKFFFPFGILDLQLFFIFLFCLCKGHYFFVFSIIYNLKLCEASTNSCDIRQHFFFFIYNI